MKYCIAARNFGRKRSHVHLNAFEPYFRAGLVLSTPEHFVHARKTGETVQSRSGVIASDEEVEVADSFPAPSKAAGRCNFLDAGGCG